MTVLQISVKFKEKLVIGIVLRHLLVMRENSSLSSGHQIVEDCILIANKVIIKWLAILLLDCPSQFLTRNGIFLILLSLLIVFKNANLLLLVMLVVMYVFGI